MDHPEGKLYEAIISAPTSGLSQSQVLVDAMETVAARTDINSLLQSTATQLCRLAPASGSALLHWVPESDHYRLLAQHPPAEIKRPEEGPIIQASPTLDAVRRSDAGIQVPFSDLAGVGLEAALGLDALAGQALLMPLIYRGEVRGVGIIWDADAQHTFTAEGITLLRVFLRHASTIAEHTRLLQEAEQTATELEAIRLASLYLTSSLKLDEVLSAILKGAATILPDMLNAHIFLYDGRTVTFGAAMWGDGRRRDIFAEPRRDGLTYTVAESGELVVVPDMRKHPLYKDTPSDWTGAIIGAPLRFGERVVGVMNIAFREPRQFGERVLRVVTLLADHAAIAINNARLHGLTQEEALTDVLTGLPNRRALDKRLAEEVRRSARYNHPFSLVMMDMDGFKRVNDNYGHALGDTVLRNIAECLRYRVRDTDFLARFGGDEFVLILPETEPKDAALIADKLRNAVADCQHDWPDGKGVDLAISVGVAAYPRDGRSAQSLLENADKAMYGFKD